MESTHWLKECVVDFNVDILHELDLSHEKYMMSWPRAMRVKKLIGDKVKYRTKIFLHFVPAPKALKYFFRRRFKVLFRMPNGKVTAG